MLLTPSWLSYRGLVAKLCERGCQPSVRRKRRSRSSSCVVFIYSVGFAFLSGASISESAGGAVPGSRGECQRSGAAHLVAVRAMSLPTDPETIRAAFDAVDEDKSGIIDGSEVRFRGSLENLPPPRLLLRLRCEQLCVSPAARKRTSPFIQPFALLCAQFEDLCLRLDPNMSGGDIDDALDMLDENGDGEISFDEFRDWWMEEKASQVQAESMSLKDRMKLLMQQQLEREAMITKTDFAADVADVDLGAKKAAMDKAKAERKSKKQWDIEGDLANREQTATAIMALFNRVRFCAPNARWRCLPPCPSDW
jgi:Ca2+-binding EF-hand superfamily protein